MSIRGELKKLEMHANGNYKGENVGIALKLNKYGVDQVISLLKAEIEKIENPHNGKWVFLDKSKAEIKQLEADTYFQAIQDILKLLKEK